jgi:hypothetical protein
MTIEEIASKIEELKKEEAFSGVTLLQTEILFAILKRIEGIEDSIDGMCGDEFDCFK